jgi:uncharacterized protein (DUF1330 family)
VGCKRDFDDLAGQVPPDLVRTDSASPLSASVATKWPMRAASVHELVHKHGGKYLSRSGNVKTLEGEPLDTTFIALLEFPSEEAVKAFATDPTYAPYAAARQAGSESRFQLIDDTDVAGTNPYLPKG